MAVRKKTASSSTTAKDKIDFSSGKYFTTQAQKHRLTATLLILKMDFERNVFDTTGREGEAWVKKNWKKYFIVPKGYGNEFALDLWQFLCGYDSGIGRAIGIYG